MSRSFDARQAQTTLFDALVDASHKYGLKKPILEDQEITIRDQLYYLTTNRHYRDSESYLLDPSTREITRSDYIEIIHHERQIAVMERPLHASMKA